MVRVNSIVGKGLLAASLIVVFSIAITILGNAEPVSDFHELPIHQDKDFKIISLEFPQSVQVGASAIGEAVIKNMGTGGGESLIELRLNGLLHSLFDLSLEPGEESRYPIRLKFRETGPVELELRTPHDSKKTNLMVSNGGEEQPPLGEPAAPPPSGSPINLRLLDTNSDCTIDDSEFFDAIDRWIANIVDDGLFFSVVDSWVSQSSVCAASLPPSEAAIQVSLSSAGGAIFTAADLSVIKMDIQVFDLTGKILFTGRTNGTRLIWNLNSRAGQPVPNGIYLYRVKTQDAMAEISLSGVKKLAVIR